MMAKMLVSTQPVFRMVRSARFTSYGRREVILSTHHARRGLASTGRPPLPPTPRVGPVAAMALRKKTPSRFRQWWDSGNLLLAVGGTGLALMVVDRYLQRVEADMKSQDLVQQIAKETAEKRAALLAENKDKPTLFTCIIRQEYKMGGSHGLQQAAVGNEVEVVEAFCGPGGYYHMCRQRLPKDSGGDDEITVGWYPVSYMEKVDKKSFLRRLVGL